MSKETEANLISFKVLLTRDNKIVTEFSMLPENEVDNIFNIDERDIIKAVLRHGKTKMGDLHNYLQRELNALKYG
jgi:alkyl hydroperoxide reductase subunit AhpC